ncbi:carbon-nitrogen hydrolase family protein [Nitratireductor sp. XY-223]|uniref:carbon-nitrogen hydrolase family protein n=1 Tax=Nitratireductor sp. XY-223 TaxID=2561926 RepID=UPI0010AAF594|nr:carbon-nitrogen hydrolase family protein [Nitratireductor sp. XY-223]
MARPVNIACLQTCPKPDFDSALDEAVELGERAVQVGADFVMLPEYCGGLTSEGPMLRPPSAPEDGHKVLDGLVAFARKHRVWMLVGSLAVRDSDGNVFNRGFVLNDAGEIVSRYDKIHMFDIDLSETVSYRESDTITPGSQAVLVETPFGVLGHTICYDLRFPHLYRDLALNGAEILLVPAAFTKKTGEAHWHVLNRARAIENGSFVVAPCAIGTIHGGGESYGHSLIVGPWGDVRADGGTLRGIVHATIDLDEISQTRQRIPSLYNGRDYSVAVPGRRRDIA